LPARPCPEDTIQQGRMPEFHAGTDIEIADAVPASGFRNAISNTKRYMKHNDVTIAYVCEAAYQGDFEKLEEMIATGDEKTLFNGDLNKHVNGITALHLAAKGGQTECVELLLRAKADPHMKESMPYGEDPEDGKTAKDFADDLGFDDIVSILEDAEKAYPYGWYVPEGPTNNAKVYGMWEWGTKPEKGWHSGRPGVAQRNGFDPRKYGGEELKPPKIFEDEGDEPDTKVASVPRVKEDPKLPIGLLFPGQGSQYVKMMQGVQDLPAVVEMLKTAKMVLGLDILQLCLKGPEAQLEETKHCQPAMFIAGLAGVEKLRREKPEAVSRCQVVAGLSLGEYTALCVAGVFTFKEGLELVKLRGEAMQAAANVSKQVMLSVAGIEKTKLADLCAQAAKKEPNGIAQIANELFPKGFSCAGTEKAVLALKELCESNGALQAKILKTSGAFHTSLMSPAVTKLGAKLDELLPKMKSPTTKVVMNANAKAVGPNTSPKEIVELLKKQLTSTVLWEPSVRAMIKDGVTEFYEVGPMKQLKAMMKRIDPKVWGNTFNVDV